MSLRYFVLPGLMTLSMVMAQTPAGQQSGQQTDQQRRGSDRTDTTSRGARSGDQSGQGGHQSGQQGGGSSSLSAADRTFVMKAAQGGKAEVEMAQMGVQQASSEAVKNFAQRLVTDHTRANEELMTLASQKGVTVSADMPKDAKTNQAKFSKMQGASFDKAFMQHMVKDHQKDIAMFEKESNSGSDPDVKAFASKTLPTLREHLEQARSVMNSLGSGREGTQSSLDPSGKKGKQP